METRQIPLTQKARQLISVFTGTNEMSVDMYVLIVSLLCKPGWINEHGCTLEEAMFYICVKDIQMIIDLSRSTYIPDPKLFNLVMQLVLSGGDK